MRIARDCKIVNGFFYGGGDDETSFVILDYVSSSVRNNSRFLYFRHSSYFLVRWRGSFQGLLTDVLMESDIFLHAYKAQDASSVNCRDNQPKAELKRI
jgi:hypothetical protein